MILYLALGALVSPEYLTSVISEPMPATGSVPEITSRAETCIGRILNAGDPGGELIVSSDPVGGAVVARNWIEYRDGLMPWKIRSRVTVEAREGRFRISHSSIERFNDQPAGLFVTGASPWVPIGKWWGSGWQKAEDALKAKSAELATCIQQAPAAESW